MPTALFERIRRADEQKQRAAHAEYDQLVRDACDGKEQDPERVIALLGLCSLTVEQLEADCRALDERRRQMPIAARLESIKGEQDAVKRKIHAEDDKFRAARTRHHEAIQPLSRRVAELENEERLADSAREWLQNPKNMPAPLRDRLNVLIQQRGELGVEQNALREALSDSYGDSLVLQLRGAERQLQRLTGKTRPGQRAEMDGVEEFHSRDPDVQATHTEAQLRRSVETFRAKVSQAIARREVINRLLAENAAAIAVVYEAALKD